MAKKQKKEQDDQSQQEKKKHRRQKTKFEKKRGKKYREVYQKLDRSRRYSVDEGFSVLKGLSYASFDETVEASFNLGIDTRKTDQVVRGAVVLPHGVGKTLRVAVVAKGDKAKEAEDAGADFVGAEELIESISNGWLEFDRMIATPDMMAQVSKVAKILGPKGLMPNPKLGLVTQEVAKAVSEQKKGKVEYRADRGGVVHVPLGKKSFGDEQLKENFKSLVTAIIRAKPTTSKGTYLKKVTVSSTMSPGVPLDTSEVSSLS